MKAENAEVREDPTEVASENIPEDAAVVEATESACPIVPVPGKQGGLGEGVAWWAVPHPPDPAPCMGLGSQ